MTYKDFFKSKKLLKDYEGFCREFDIRNLNSVHALALYFKNKFKDENGEL